MALRTSASKWRLLRDAAGSPEELRAKFARLGLTLRGYVQHEPLDRRLQRLQSIGYVEAAPSRLQLVLGSLDMLRFWIVPASDDYYKKMGIGFGFHQLLRFLDEPASLVDPTGFISSVDNIVGHLMQVVHANPLYDLQLLESHEDGLVELERQLEAMIDGSHPRHRSIGAIVEEPEYHQRLLDYVRAYRAGQHHEPLLRSNIDSDRFREIERTFGSLPAAMRYFGRLPNRPAAALRHLIEVRSFPWRFAEPQ